jgi:HSP20 family molecular chaperone IbpA
MATIDLTPLYRSTIGFDRMASILDAAMRADTSTGYPPYNIEALEVTKSVWQSRVSRKKSLNWKLSVAC